jgi:hypothetical protein
VQDRGQTQQQLCNRGQAEEGATMDMCYVGRERRVGVNQCLPMRMATDADAGMLMASPLLFPQARPQGVFTQWRASQSKQMAATYRIEAV